MDNWRQLVESLYRLYRENKVSKERILSLYNDKILTKAEMDYILSATR